MATRSLLIFPSPYLSLSNPTTTTPGSFNFKPPYFPEIRISRSRRQVRGMGVVTRAGPPSTSSYVFAFVLPLSLLAITAFTSIAISDKLDRDYLEELAINEAIRKAEEEEEEGDVEIEEEQGGGGGGGGGEEEEEAKQEPELPRPRNRPRKEVEA